MNRRHFIKVSAAASTVLLLNRITYGQGKQHLLVVPAEAWAQTGSGWHKMNRTGQVGFAFNDIDLGFKTYGGVLSAYIRAPKTSLKGIRLVWKHSDVVVKSLGDEFERLYGDAAWRQPDEHILNAWYVMLFDGIHTAGFGVKTGCNSVCWWTVKPGDIELTLDTSSGGNGVELGERQLHAADIVTIKSTPGETPFAATRRFCRMMCNNPRLPRQPVYGINDWYFAYGANSFDLIKNTTAMMAELVTNADNRPFSVIDAGWAKYSPYLPNDGGWADDFSKPNDKFKDMHLMADEIKKLGMRPGLWTRPLCAKYNDSATLLAPKIKGRDDPKNPILDPTIPENIERVKFNVSTYKEWGYDLVKHDYSTYDITGRWGFQMTDGITEPGWNFNDRSKTNAEIIKHLYAAIRDAAGDMYLIGCNTMSHLSAGVFEMNRIGDDTSGKEWERTRKMGVNALAFRLPQHNTFYAADGDCVGLTTDISWARNKQWMQLLAQSSAPLFISAQKEALGAEQRAFMKQCFADASKVQPPAEPLDWMDNPRPQKWTLDGKEVNFNWD
jgi:alpha-galactosidase